MRPVRLDRDVTLIGNSVGAEFTVLLLHAGGEKRTVWRPIMHDLNDSGIGSIAFDQRGHGESGGGRSDSVVTFGADAAAMIAEADCPVVVGASLGGFAAMLALAEPEVQAQAAGLMLIDVLPDPDPDRTRAFLAGGGRQPLVDDILGRADQLRAAAASLELPVLLVRAGRNGAISDVEVDDLAERVPQLKTVSVPTAGHLIARDAPSELAALIRDFVLSDAVRGRRAAWRSQRSA